jgi:hypothetical protein
VSLDAITVPRDPKQDPRTLRFMQQVASVLNAFLRSGAFTQDGAASFTFGEGSVTSAMLRDSAAVSVIGRSANTLGVPADIAAAANDRLLARTSDTLAFQQLTDGMVAANTLAITKLANQVQTTILGRAAGAGTGAVTALSAAQLLAILLTVDGTGSGLDADLLDGLNSTAFALAVHTHVAADITDLGAVTRKYTALVGDALATVITVTQATHGLAANSSLLVQCWNVTTGAAEAPTVNVNNANGTVTLTFGVAPATNDVRVVIIG